MFYVTFGDAQQILEPEDNDATSDSELQSSDSEDDAQSDSLEMGDFIELIVTRYPLSQTLMSNALQYKASKGFRCISCI